LTLISACSSDDDAGGSEKPGCRPDPELVARREACEFKTGSMPAQTIGSCPGNQIPIEHVVLIMQENRSFDHYFGHLKGNGQDDIDVASADVTNPSAVTGDPAVKWHHENAYCVEDTDHGWQASHGQWNNGKNDGFAQTNADSTDPSGGRALGYYDQTDIPFYYELASKFAISDRYFCSLLGPTYPNRMYFYAGTSFGVVTTSIATLAPPKSPVIFRQLAAKGITWKVYKTTLPSAAIFIDLLTDFQDNFLPAAQFATDAAAGTLPQVSFVDSGFNQAAAVETDEHEPGNIQLGQHWVYDQVTALLQSPLWPKSALFITYDEHGGLYDHVSPPSACVPDETAPKLNPELGAFDRLGFRVPLIVVSPYARRSFVSHEVHSHTSILRFLQTKFELEALTNRDANSDAMLDLFDFDSPPVLDVPALSEPPVDATQLTACETAFPN
jgi:phospholipase C